MPRLLVDGTSLIATSPSFHQVVRTVGGVGGQSADQSTEVDDHEEETCGTFAPSLAAWVAAFLMLGGLLGAWAVGSASAAPDRAPAPSAPVSADRRR